MLKKGRLMKHNVVKSKNTEMSRGRSLQSLFLASTDSAQVERANARST